MRRSLLLALPVSLLGVAVAFYVSFDDSTQLPLVSAPPRGLTPGSQVPDIAQVDQPAVNEKDAAIDIHFEHGLLSGRFEGADLRKAMAEISRLTNLEVQVSDDHRAVALTQVFEKVPLETALRSLLNGLNYVFLYDEVDGIETIAGVSVLRSSNEVPVPDTSGVRAAISSLRSSAIPAADQTIMSREEMRKLVTDRITELRTNVGEASQTRSEAAVLDSDQVRAKIEAMLRERGLNPG